MKKLWRNPWSRYLIAVEVGAVLMMLYLVFVWGYHDGPTEPCGFEVVEVYVTNDGDTLHTCGQDGTVASTYRLIS